MIIYQKKSPHSSDRTGLGKKNGAKLGELRWNFLLLADLPCIGRLHCLTALKVGIFKHSSYLWHHPVFRALRLRDGKDTTVYHLLGERERDVKKDKREQDDNVAKATPLHISDITSRVDTFPARMWLS